MRVAAIKIISHPTGHRPVLPGLARGPLRCWSCVWVRARPEAHGAKKPLAFHHYASGRIVDWFMLLLDGDGTFVQAEDRHKCADIKPLLPSMLGPGVARALPSAQATDAAGMPQGCHSLTAHRQAAIGPHSEEACGKMSPAPACR